MNGISVFPLSIEEIDNWESMVGSNICERDFELIRDGDHFEERLFDI